MRSLSLLAAVVILACAGCGTMANLSGRQFALISRPGEVPVQPFGGVSRDVAWMKNATRLGDPVATAFFVADVPFSFVGDVVTLPQTIATSRRETKETEPDQ